MSSLAILLFSIVVLFIGYLAYGGWLAKKWCVNPDIKTPAHTVNDGLDYVPAKAPVLLGHHFASIAGAGPITGPIQAAVFGWIPVLLWIILGGIFIGAVHDFSSLLASVRHNGKSIGTIIEVHMGKRCKRLFLAFAWLTLILIIASFADIVANTFAGFDSDGARLPANGSTAMTSMLFMIISIVFGFMVYRRNVNLGVATLIGIIFVGICIALGLKFPICMTKNFWLAVIFIYIIMASVVPVWILLQPRDYLNSFLLYAMLLGAVVGIVVNNPTVALPAFTSFKVGSSYMFPMLFITVACGSISGFHSLVSSGITSKQLNNERDALPIGYGGMLIECGVAVIALIAVGVLFANGKMPNGTPAMIFATAISGLLDILGIPISVSYTVLALAISAFSLTTLDTATRLARYIFQELFVDEGADVLQLTGFAKLAANKYFATVITVIVGGGLAITGYQNIWPLFGSANQLLAALSLLAASVWQSHAGKQNKMLYMPMIFMLCVTLTALILTIKNNLALLTSGAGSICLEGLQIFFSVLLFILAIFLVIEGFGVLGKKSKCSKPML